jgi:hypothetical protein
MTARHCSFRWTCFANRACVVGKTWAFNRFGLQPPPAPSASAGLWGLVFSGSQAKNISYSTDHRQ